MRVLDVAITTRITKSIITPVFARQRQVVRFALVALALAACQHDTRAPARADSSAATRVESATGAHLGVDDSATRRDRSVLLALDGEGLRLVVAATGSTRLLAFGTDSAAVLDGLGRALGAPTSRGSNAECGAGPVDFASFDGGLSVNFQSGRFVGWSARASNTSSALTTMSGIGVGSTRAALDSTYSARVAQSSLGTEFSAGDLSGILDGTAPSSRIANLWAGVNCIAR